MDKVRNLKGIAVTQEILGVLFTQDMEYILGDRKVTCTNGIPLDATCTGVYYNPSLRIFEIYYEHPSFSEVLPGGQVPLDPVECKTEPLEETT